MARILVVEDNAQNLQLTAIILKSSGHTVISAIDSAEAERAIAEGLPDLIIMDVGLPGKDGYALTRELRGRTATARLPILALSAFAMPGDAEKAIDAGATAYLTKPVRRAQLLERVAHVLGTGGASVPAAVPPAAKPAVSTPDTANRPESP